MFAPTVFAQEPEAKAADIRKKDFETAMTRLLDASKIHPAPYGPPCRETIRLAPGPKPEPQS
jgi:hypothetical protein